jgi:microcin C transport system substrate-binding protein
MLSFVANSAFAAHGVSIDGNLKYPADFTHFAYTSDTAKKGGTLTLHSIGSFDKLNPFTLKGLSPFLFGGFLFDTLAVSSLDEPFSYYGLVAEDIELAADQMSVRFRINKSARFSDGMPVTAHDVKYSLDTLKSDKAHPHYQIYYQDISHAEVSGEYEVTFHFSRPNRELHMIACQLPVLQAAFYKQHGFNKTGTDPLTVPVGSGPYLVAAIKPGKAITYRRNPDYWAVDHPTRRYQYNFDTVTVKYYKDKTVSLEAFKAGDFDFLLVNNSKQWARDLVGKRFDSGELVKKAFPHHNNAGLQGFVFNT